MANQPATRNEPPPLDVPFERSLGELEAVVKQLESTELPLEKALELFERGIHLSDVCRKQLTEAEMRVEILTKKGEQTVATPFPTDSDDIPF